MARRRLKKEVYYYLGFIVLFLIAGIYGYTKYQEFKYKETNEYKLIELGYTKDEAKIIEDTFKDKETIDFFLNNKANARYIELLTNKKFLKRNFNRYVEYLKNNKKMDIDTIIKNINVHIEKPFYVETTPSNITLDTKLIVNKYYVLSEDYEPDDLAVVSQKYSYGTLGSQKARQVAYDAFIDMWEAAQEEGLYLIITSSYRSYQDQASVYENYKKSRGQKYADSIAARPGSSEHQTGLALDIYTKAHPNRDSFTNSEDAKWLANNAHKYGFILRFPEDKVNITGYNYESWHFRYVGKEIATAIYEKDMSYEEYYALYIEK